MAAPLNCLIANFTTTHKEEMHSNYTLPEDAPVTKNNIYLSVCVFANSVQQPAVNHCNIFDNNYCSSAHQFLNFPTFTGKLKLLYVAFAVQYSD